MIRTEPIHGPATTETLQLTGADRLAGDVRARGEGRTAERAGQGGMTRSFAHTFTRALAVGLGVLALIFVAAFALGGSFGYVVFAVFAAVAGICLAFPGNGTFLATEEPLTNFRDGEIWVGSSPTEFSAISDT